MKFLKIFSQPSQLFLHLKERPKFVYALVLVILFSILGNLLFLSYIDWAEAKAKIEEQLLERNVPQEEIDKIMERMNPKTNIIWGTGATILLVPLGILISTLIFFLILPLFGSEASFVKVLAVVSHSALIRIPAFILKSIVVIIKGSGPVHTSLALFLPKFDQKGFLDNFLSRIDFFTVWEVFLLGLGLKIVFNQTGNKSYYLVFSVWLLYNILFSLMPGRGF